MQQQLTIRGFDQSLRERLEEVARNEGTSLNKAALLLLRRGAGLTTEAPRPEVVGHSLDAFIGTWSKEDERELLEAVEVFEQVDESFWS